VPEPQPSPSRPSRPPCAACGFELSQDWVEANSHVYHRSCFVCCQCGKELGGLPFIPADGAKALCVDCHESQLERCAGCGLVIKGPHLRALDKIWHGECWKCGSCGLAFPEGRFYALDGLALCGECIPKQGGVTTDSHECDTCHTLIDTEAVMALGRYFHADRGCFKCNKCGTQIQGTQFLIAEIDGKDQPFHDGCL
jgi:hypothetical protein